MAPTQDTRTPPRGETLGAQGEGERQGNTQLNKGQYSILLDCDRGEH